MPTSPPPSAAGIVWNLSDLYAGVDDPKIEADLQECTARCTAFADKYRALFASPEALTAGGLYQALIDYERIAERMSRLGAYAGLLTAADTANDAFRRLEDRLQQQLVERENQLTFFDLGWLAVDEQVAAGLMADPILANYQHHLSSSRRYKPHTKSEPEELLLNQKSLTARAAWTTLFDEFVASLQYTLDYNGQKRTLTQPAILALNYDADRGLFGRVLEDADGIRHNWHSDLRLAELAGDFMRIANQHADRLEFPD
jgi:oligoendopeptidase F